MSANDAPRTLSRPFEPLMVDRRVVASDLFGQSREVLIEHRGEVYRLRLTRQDKLILTK